MPDEDYPKGMDFIVKHEPGPALANPSYEKTCATCYRGCLLTDNLYTACHENGMDMWLKLETAAPEVDWEAKYKTLNEFWKNSAEEIKMWETKYRELLRNRTQIIADLEFKLIREQHFRALWNRKYCELVEEQADE